MLLPKALTGQTFTDYDPTLGANVTYKVISTSERTCQIGDGSNNAFPTSSSPTGSYAIRSSVTYNNKPYTVTRIACNALSGCGNMTSVSIGNTVTSIGDKAFSNCTKLASITIPMNVSSIGHNAFFSCRGLVTIKVDPRNSTYDSREDCNGIIKTASNTLVVACPSTIIPKTVTKIGNCAYLPIHNGSYYTYKDGGFYRSSGAESGESPVTIDIPDNVVEIGDSAFYRLYRLISIKIPSSVKRIGDYAFFYTKNCPISLTEGLEHIGKMAFGSFSGDNWTRKGSLVIPSTVKYIDAGAFKYESFESIISYIKEPFDISDDVFEDEKGNFTSTTLYVPDGTKSKYQACKGWKYFLNNIVEMEDEPQPATNVFTAKTKEGVEMTFAVLDENKKTCQVGTGNYDEETFYYENAIDWKTQGCITIPEIVNGYTVAGIGSYAFDGCFDITEVVFPESIEFINENAFVCCGIKNLSLPPYLKTIGNWAFHETAIESVAIPASVQSIGDAAFSLCYQLTSVVSYIMEPFELQEPTEKDAWEVFGGNNLSSVILYVPYSTKAKYQAARGWMDFPNIVEMSDEPEQTTQGDVNGDGSVNGTDLVALANIILGKQSETAAADVNGDGAVNGTDIVALCNIILGRTTAAAPRRAATLSANEGASLAIQPLDIEAGETKTMTIDLNNPNDELTLVQFDLHLPKGLGIKTVGGDLDIDMCDRTNWRKHSLEANEVDGGAYRFLLYSSSNTLISGTEGGIITVNLVADNTFAGGNIVIDNALLVSPEQEETKPAKYEYTIGEVTPPVPPTSDAAALAIESFSIKAGETKTMTINLNNPNDELTLVQFDLHLPKGLGIKTVGGDLDIDMCDRTNWRKHSLEANEVDDAYRFLLYSSSNALISGTEGGIITVNLVADNTFAGGNIVIDNALLVSPEQEETKPETYQYTIGSTTGIDDITTVQTPQRIFNLNGQQLRVPQRGINIVDGKKVWVK